MRVYLQISLSIILLFTLGAMARGHDESFGFMSCYTAGHCAQDTLVFGTIVSEDADAFTLSVQKVLRGTWNTAKPIRFKKTGWRSPVFSEGTLTVGKGVAISFLRKSASPHKANYVLISTTTDYRTMKVEGRNNCVDIEYFIHSGGTEDQFYHTNNKTYVHRHDGVTEEIPLRPVIPASIHSKTPPASPPIAFPVAEAIIGSAGIILITFLAWIQFRRKKSI